MLRRIDTLDADIAALDARVDELIAPFADAVNKLDEIPGIGQRSAQELVAEIGVTMIDVDDGAPCRAVVAAPQPRLCQCGGGGGGCPGGHDAGAVRRRERKPAVKLP
jgi:hypothetical protein